MNTDKRQQRAEIAAGIIGSLKIALEYGDLRDPVMAARLTADIARYDETFPPEWRVTDAEAA